LSGFGAFFLAAGAIVWFDIRTRRINSLEEVAGGLRLPILGSLPSVPRRAAATKSGRGAVDAAVWQGSLMESVDSARVMLLRKAQLENAKVAMIVSALSSEGKTTLSCHLATSLARAGHRTLLIDTDIRRPSVHRVFDVPNTPGLCELLTGQGDLTEAVAPTSQDGLFVISAGQLSPETLRALAQDGLRQMMATLREQFDFVILDSSPILPVTDSLLISQYADGCIFSIRRDVSQYPKVATACQRLSMMGIPMWGAVVIGLDQLSYGYRYAYYGYGYGYAAKQPTQPTS
jgi:capsular exopolysaccharide synthesis family protein